MGFAGPAFIGGCTEKPAILGDQMASVTKKTMTTTAPTTGQIDVAVIPPEIAVTNGDLGKFIELLKNQSRRISANRRDGTVIPYTRERALEEMTIGGWTNTGITEQQFNDIQRACTASKAKMHAIGMVIARNEVRYDWGFEAIHKNFWISAELYQALVKKVEALKKVETKRAEAFKERGVEDAIPFWSDVAESAPKLAKILGQLVDGEFAAIEPGRTEREPVNYKVAPEVSDMIAVTAAATNRSNTKLVEDLVYKFAGTLLRDQIRDWRIEVGDTPNNESAGNEAMTDAAIRVHQILCKRHPEHFKPRSYETVGDRPEDGKEAVGMMEFYTQMMLRLISTLGNQAALASEVATQYGDAESDEDRDELWEQFKQTTKLESHMKSLRMNLSQSEWAKQPMLAEAKPEE